MNDPIVVRFLNERVRPLCELIRDLKYRLADGAADYTNNVQPLIAGFADAEPVDDGRPDVNNMNCGEVRAVLTLMGGLRTTLDAVNANTTAQAKACVRGLVQ